MNQPDRSAPRFRYNTKKVIDQEFYKKLNKEYPDLCFKHTDVKKIMDTFHDLCKDVIANNRDGLDLPEQIGTIFVAQFKKDIIKSKNEFYKQLFSDSSWEWKTGQHICKILYINSLQKYKFKNSIFWTFVAGRDLKKRVSQAYVKNHTKYIKLKNFFQLRPLFRK